MESAGRAALGLAAEGAGLSGSPSGLQLIFLRDTPSTRLFVVALLGFFWDPALTRVFHWAGHIDIPVMESVFRLHLTPKSHLDVLSRSVLAVLWTVVLGLVYGLPLGLLARRQALRYWFVFALSALVGSAVSAWLRGSGTPGFLGEWTLPEPWLWLVGALPFALIGSRLTLRRRRVAT